MSRAQLVFTNSVPYLDYPRLTLRKVLDLGGITYQQPNPLSTVFIQKVYGLKIALSRNGKNSSREGQQSYSRLVQ